jgi:hypothetical protein
MHKISFISLFFIFFVAGCVSVQNDLSSKVVHVDENNAFHSEIPKLDIQIAKEIKYIKGIGINKNAHYTDKVGTSNNNSKLYFFVDPENKHISKPIFVYINIEKLTADRVYWNSIDFKTWKGVIDHGTEKINGRAYKYAYIQSIPIPKELFLEAAESIKNKNIKITHEIKKETIMTKFYTRRAGANNRIMVHIGYTEGIDSSMGSWDNPRILSGEQKEFLKSFDKRCSENMAFFK